MSLLSVIAGPVLKIIDKVIPDPEARAKAQLEVLRLQDSADARQIEADVRVALGQLEVNKAEAESGSWFRAGWRPATGWICALALGYQFLLRPLLTWGVTAYGTYAEWATDAILLSTPPTLDMSTLLTVLGGMLGLGTMRGIEKINGIK